MDSPTYDRGHDGPVTRARVAFYGRVARDDQPLLSLQRQLRAVRAVLGAMTPIVGCYADVGPYHGLGTGGRSVAGCWLGDDQVAGGIDQPLARAASSERDFEVVACSSIDRLSLRHLDGVRIEADLAEHTVRVVAADEPTSHVLSSLAEVPDAHTMTTRATLRRWAWELVTDECTRLSGTTRERLLAQGWHLGPAPYGYTTETVTVAGVRRARLLAEPTQATIVQSIFFSYVCRAPWCRRDRPRPQRACLVGGRVPAPRRRFASTLDGGPGPGGSVQPRLHRVTGDQPTRRRTTSSSRPRVDVVGGDRSRADRHQRHLPYSTTNRTWPTVLIRGSHGQRDGDAMTPRRSQRTCGVFSSKHIACSTWTEVSWTTAYPTAAERGCGKEADSEQAARRLA